MAELQSPGVELKNGAKAIESHKTYYRKLDGIF